MPVQCKVGCLNCSKQTFELCSVQWRERSHQVVIRSMRVVSKRSKVAKSLGSAVLTSNRGVLIKTWSYAWSPPDNCKASSRYVLEYVWSSKIAGSSSAVKESQNVDNAAPKPIASEMVAAATGGGDICMWTRSDSAIANARHSILQRGITGCYSTLSTNTTIKRINWGILSMNDILCELQGAPASWKANVMYT